jgi:hypothetical protein
MSFAGAGCSGKTNLGALRRFWKTPQLLLDERIQGHTFVAVFVRGLFPERSALGRPTLFLETKAMRPIFLALLVVLLIESSSSRMATAEQASSWWPFGRANDEQSSPFDAAEGAAVAPDTEMDQPEMTPDPGSAEPEARWMIDSPFAKVSWPRLHMPEISRPPMPRFLAKRTEVDAQHNAWMEQEPDVTPPSPWESVTDGFKRAGDSTRAAWHRTVDSLTPGGSEATPSSRVAREGGQSWWNRMFAPEEPEREGPQTVTEWMAQERLDP